MIKIQLATYMRGGKVEAYTRPPPTSTTINVDRRAGSWSTTLGELASAFVETEHDVIMNVNNEGRFSC
jgi:hypothetical protein